jgi:hypothetical protein
MSWFKIDDGFYSHPKVKSIPRRDRAAAIGLWTQAGSWCSAQLTDGHVPEYMLDEFAAPPKLAAALVTARLWDSNKEKGGWDFHDYHDHQPSRETVQAKRKQNADRIAAWRAGKKGVSNAGVAPLQGEYTDVTDSFGNADVAPPPTRPDPTRPDPVKEETTQEDIGSHLSNANGFDHTADDEPRSKPVPPNINRIAKRYTDIVRLSDRGKVCAVVLNAVGAGYQENQIGEALERLGHLEMPVTADTLRIEITGKASNGRASPLKPSTTDQRVNQGLDLARKYAEREAAEEKQRLEIEA